MLFEEWIAKPSVRETLQQLYNTDSNASFEYIFNSGKMLGFMEAYRKAKQQLLVTRGLIQLWTSTEREES